MAELRILITNYFGIYNGKLVLMSEYSNSIIIIDTEKNVIDKIIQLEEQLESSAFRGMVVCDDYVVLIPFNSDYVYYVNLINQDVKKFCVLQNHQNDISAKYLKGISNKNDLWCLGENINNILHFKLEDSIDLVNSKEYDSDLRWIDAHIKVDEYIYIPSKNKNVVMSINTITYDISVTEIENLICKGFSDICSFDNVIYLFDIEGNTFLWNRKNQAYKIEIESHNQIIISKHSFCYDNKMYRFGFYDNYIVLQDSKLNNIKKIVIPTKNYQVGTIFNNGVVIGTNYFFETRYGKLFSFDFSSNELQEITLENLEDYKELEIKATKSMFKDTCVDERSLSLQEFIETIVN